MPTIDAVNSMREESLSGRLPIDGHSRIYCDFFTVLMASIAIGAASFNYLFGSSLTIIGNTKIAIFGYLIGLIVGLAPTFLASGLISHRHGVDPVDAAKSAFGIRGSSLMLILILVTTLGWSFVLIAMTGQAAARLYQEVLYPAGGVSDRVAEIVSLGMLILIWVLLRKGPSIIAPLTRVTSPGVFVVAIVLLYLISRHSGLWSLIETNIDPKSAYTKDPLLQLAYAVEFGVSNAFTIVPFFGGTARLIQRRKHLITPNLLGAGLIGAGFVTSVGALAAIATGSTEPAQWVVISAGTGLGSLIVIMLLAANLGTLVSFFYLSGVSVQQVKFFARLRWDVTILLLLLPGIFVAFHTVWLIDHVMNWLSYNSAIFAPIAAIMLADYLLLRRLKVFPTHFFVNNRESAYWFWHGFNFIALGAVAFGICVYLLIYNPQSQTVAPIFRYAGAGVPTFILSFAAYYLAMRLLSGISRMGDYDNEIGSSIQIFSPKL